MKVILSTVLAAMILSPAAFAASNRVANCTAKTFKGETKFGGDVVDVTSVDGELAVIADAQVGDKKVLVMAEYMGDNSSEEGAYQQLQVRIDSSNAASVSRSPLQRVSTAQLKNGAKFATEKLSGELLDRKTGQLEVECEVSQK